MNLLQDISQGLSPLTWTNAPARWEPLPSGGLRAHASEKTDFFQNPNGSPGSDSAHILWLPVEGEFVARAHVQPTFASTYDAGALMVRHDETHWAKLCFEATDLGTHAAVSVVTNGVSDDANGADLEAERLWLQVVRQGDLFGMHYSLDGASWRMVRYFALPMPRQVQVGLVAQSPIGPGTSVDFHSFSVEPRRIANMRAGI
jgi:regulation of enolase protein 1 (concanavalin A-like superfamily)